MAYSHITQLLIQLPDESRVHFKILGLTSRAFHKQTSAYMSKLLDP